MCPKTWQQRPENTVQCFVCVEPLNLQGVNIQFFVVTNVETGSAICINIQHVADSVSKIWM